MTWNDYIMFDSRAPNIHLQLKQIYDPKETQTEHYVTITNLWNTVYPYRGNVAVRTYVLAHATYLHISHYGNFRPVNRNMKGHTKMNSGRAMENELVHHKKLVGHNV